MRIGRFAKKNNLTTDALRHYMDLGLLLPQKTGGQYDFDERCQEDLDLLFAYRDMGFNLKEIRTIFWFSRLGTLRTEGEIDHLVGLMREKRDHLAGEIEERQRFIENLDARIESLEQRTGGKRQRLDLPLSTLQDFACHVCGGALQLSADEVVDNQVHSGTLRCSCGQEYRIDSGILFSEGVRRSEESFKYSMLTFINGTPPVYLNAFTEGLAWFLKSLDFKDLSGKRILELGSGVGFFLRHVLGNLPEDCIYYAVDFHEGLVRQLKAILETLEIRRKIVFICADFRAIPLKKGSVEVVVDQSGSSNFAFDEPAFLLELIAPLVAPEATLAGAYIFYDHFGPSAVVSADKRPQFQEAVVLERIERLGFRSLAMRKGPLIDEIGGAHENYLQPGDRIHMVSLIARKDGVHPTV
jgi:DNA-binding transcriptional MerR regulator/SAM-dependent methyltransferase